jgi:hypothetical protein
MVNSSRQKIQFYIFLIVFFVQSSLVKAQMDSLDAKKIHEFSTSLSAVYVSIFSKAFPGFSLELKYFPMPRYSTGIYIGDASRNVTDTFGYSLQAPHVNYYQFAWINQYDIINRKIFRLSGSLLSGLALAKLEDNGKEVEHTVFSKHGAYHTYSEPTVAKNKYFLLRPRFDIACRVLPRSIKVPAMYVLMSIGYNLVSGESNFSTTKEFSSYVVSAGVSIGGFLGDTTQ